MGVGVRLNNVYCNLESSSGITNRRKAKRRDRYSDEVQVLVAVLDEETGRLITTYNHVSGNVDSGDVINIDELLLYPEAHEYGHVRIKVLVLEIDGVKKLEKYTQANYAEWKKAARFQVISDGQEDMDSVSLGFASPFFAASFKALSEPDLLAYDEFTISRNQVNGHFEVENIPAEASPFYRASGSSQVTIDSKPTVKLPKEPGSGEPIEVTIKEGVAVGIKKDPIKIIRSHAYTRPHENRLQLVCAYNSDEANSRYSLTFTFSI